MKETCSKKEDLIAIFFLTLLVFIQGIISGSQLIGDQLGHYFFATYNKHNLTYLITDTWTRPIPNFLYCFGDVLGLNWVFIIPLTLTVLTAVFLNKLISRLLSKKISFFATIIFFFTQYPILNIGYLTMTEVPAYCLLSLSLMLFVSEAKHKKLMAYFTLGLLPLCRMEGFIQAGVIFLCFIVYEKKFLNLSLKDLFFRLLLISVPFAGIVVAGGYLKNDYFWFLKSEYLKSHGNIPFVRFRTGPLIWYFICNSFTMIPRLLSPVLIPFFFIGLISLFKKTKYAFIFYAALITEVLLLDLTINGIDSWDFIFAAGYYRYYSLVAPVIAVFIAMGFIEFLENTKPKIIKTGFIISIVNVLFAFPFLLLDRTGFKGLQPAVYNNLLNEKINYEELLKLLLNDFLNINTSVMLFVPLIPICSIFILFIKPDLFFKTKERINNLLFKSLQPEKKIIPFLISFILTLSLIPEGIYLTTKDKECLVVVYKGLEEFGKLYKSEYKTKNPDVVQRIQATVAPFCGVDFTDLKSPNLFWRWEIDFNKEIKNGKSGTLFLINVVEDKKIEKSEIDPEFFDKNAFKDISMDFYYKGKKYKIIAFEKII